MNVLVVGESCCDIFQYGKAERLSPEAPVPVFSPTTKTKNAGMAGNVKNNLLALGVEVDIHTNENWETITKTRLIEPKNNHMLLRVDENDQQYGRSNLRNIDFSKYDAVIISDYDKGFLTEAEIKYIALSHPLTFLDTKKRLGNWAKNITYIKVNNYEFQKAKNNLSKELLDKIIVTLGPNGATFQGKNFPVHEVPIRDVSGAGDSFLSGLAVKFLQTKDISKAIPFANACATQVVQHKGVTVLNLEEVLSIL